MVLADFRLKSIKEYIGYSTDDEIRYNASSGGVGSSLIKYLFDTKQIDNSITFIFNNNVCKYEPQLINNFDDYNICGSVYQDVDLIKFIKDNIELLRGKRVALSALPCQVKPLRFILKNNNVECFIISFVCSGQLIIDGTYCLYRFLGIKREDVKYMQYRGKGWPSGIHIQLNNGKEYFKDNYSFPWSLIHSSYLFHPKRCFLCKETISENSDMSIADPWLQSYIGKDSIGYTLFTVNTAKCYNIINEMCSSKYLQLEDATQEDIYMSQKHTFKRKQSISVAINKRLAILYSNKIYRFIFSYNIILMKIHTNFLSRVFRKILSIHVEH